MGMENFHEQMVVNMKGNSLKTTLKDKVHTNGVMKEFISVCGSKIK